MSKKEFLRASVAGAVAVAMLATPFAAQANSVENSVVSVASTQENASAGHVDASSEDLAEVIAQAMTLKIFDTLEADLANGSVSRADYSAIRAELIGASPVVPGEVGTAGVPAVLGTIMLGCAVSVLSGMGHAVVKQLIRERGLSGLAYDLTDAAWDCAWGGFLGAGLGALARYVVRKVGLTELKKNMRQYIKESIENFFRDRSYVESSPLPAGALRVS